MANGFSVRSAISEPIDFRVFSVERIFLNTELGVGLLLRGEIRLTSFLLSIGPKKKNFGLKVVESIGNTSVVKLKKAR